MKIYIVVRKDMSEPYESDIMACYDTYEEANEHARTGNFIAGLREQWSVYTSELISKTIPMSTQSDNKIDG